MAKLSLAADAGGVCADLGLLAEAAEGSFQLCQCLLDALNSGAQLVGVHREVLVAGTAGEFRVQFELSDRLRDLLAAVRAGEFDCLAVQRSSHGHPSRK